MKRIFTSALALLLLTGAAQAQTKKQDKQAQKREAVHKKEKEFEKLNLTAEQQARFKALHEQRRAEMQALKSNTSLTTEQQKAAKKQLHDKYKAQMEAILTMEQKQQLNAKKTERSAYANKSWDKKDNVRDTIRARNAEVRGGGGHVGPRGAGKESELKELNLTAEQKQKIQQIRAGYRPKMEAVRADKSLTQEQKRAKYQELMNVQHEQIKAVLTQEQIQKMQDSRKGRTARAVK